MGGDSKEAFVSKMTNYILNPSEEEALMKGPIKRFGLMPKNVLTKGEIKSIAAYIYDFEIAEPEWYAAHHAEKHADGMHREGGRHGKQKKKGYNE